MLLDELPAETRDSDIYVDKSTTGGLGVFLSLGDELEVGDVVTEFPGEPRWVSHEYIHRLKGEKGQYSFHFGPFHMGQVGNMYILWDAYSKRRSGFTGPKAHWINTSHPCLKGFWSRPNCVFGLFLKNLDISGMSHPPNVRLFVLCSESFKGDREKELLLDYHWHVTEHFGVICGDYTCKNCFDSMRNFMIQWERKLVGQDVPL